MRFAPRLHALRRRSAVARGAGEELWEPVAEHWIEEQPQALWRRHSDAVNTRLIERWLPAGLERVLKTDVFDEAVGGGLYPALAARAREVTVVDVSAPLLAAAHERYPALCAVHADVRRLPFGDAEFDAVVSNSTLDHFEREDDILVALRELRRVLRPGGTLVLTLDNPANPLVAALKLAPRGLLNRLWLGGRRGARIGLVPYYVGATLGTRELRRLLPGLGFDVVELDAIVHVPRPLAVVVGELVGRASPRVRRRYLGALMAFERLAGLPTRRFTGHFVAVKAIRR